TNPRPATVAPPPPPPSLSRWSTAATTSHATDLLSSSGVGDSEASRTFLVCRLRDWWDDGDGGGGMMMRSG
ncbi:hypothetical protein LINGRAHAP2_LOCUS32307, partial [Linum grandiflorum]